MLHDIPSSCAPDQTPDHTRARPLPTLGLLPAIALTAAAFGTPALSQSGEDLGTVTLQSAGGGYLAADSTSRKATAPLIDTPKSVTVISRKVIEERGQTSLTDILRTTPGITLGSAEGGTAIGDRPNIRGFDATTDLMVDGLRSVARTSYESFNLETVEVTKGPDGATAGRGSTGGAINMTSKAPLDEDFTDTALTFGTGGFHRATLDTNRDFGALGLRLNLMAQGADDLGGRKGVTSERYGIAPSLAYDFEDGARLTAGLYYYVNHDMPDLGVVMSTANTPTDLRRGSGTKDDPYLPVLTPNDAWFGLSSKDFRDLESRALTLSYEREVFGGFTWSSTLRLSSDKNSYIGTKGRSLATNPTLATRQTLSARRETEALAFNSQIAGETTAFGMEHSLAIGLDISREKSKSGNWVATGVTLPPADYLAPDRGQSWSGSYAPSDWTAQGKTSAIGVYAFDTLTISPKWEASAGLRFDSYKVDYTSGTPATLLENDTSFWNGSLGLVYKPNENSSIYGRISTSANPSSDAAGIDASNSLTTLTANLKPERSYSYEIGAKWMNADQSLMVSGAIFLTDKDNARVTDELGNTALIGNTRARGFELGVSGQLTEKFALTGGYTYIDAEYVNAGFTAGLPSANNGNKVAGVIPHSLSLWGTYQVNDALTLGMGGTYLSKRYANAGNTAEVPSSVQIDAMARYDFGNDLALRVNVNNIFNDTVYGSAHVNGSEQVNLGAARNVQLTLTKAF